MGARILRIGLGVTFLVIGILIWRHPEAWGSNIQPWVQSLINIPLRQLMQIVAVFDIALGVLLILGIFVWFFSLLAALHLAGVLLVVGFSETSIRDFGLLAAAISLFLTYRDSSKQRKSQRIIETF